ncbi:protein MMS22-like isoform X2 [Haliotis rufescens]|uniref:protein MMS22-like isoform X2 n=1 Tax=Haliotis rufescens TaxID=6454 RepID=UPI00201F1AD4|nr:protein MMS22-like isoform X2 [Haliotis rufescens]
MKTMCDADSCSMTPPHSPLPLQFEDFMEPSPPKLLRGPINGQDGNHAIALDDEVPESWTVPCFTCGGDVHGICKTFYLHDNSIIKKGALKRMIHPSPELSPASRAVVMELFGFQFVNQLALIEHTEKLFLLAKSCVSSIQSGVLGPSEEGPGELRKQLQEFLEYIKQFLLHFLPTDVTRREVFVTSLVSELHGLLLYSGRLSDVLQFVPHSAPVFFGNKTDGSHHQFHLQLDLYWSLLDIFNIIYAQCAGVSVRRPLCAAIEDAMTDVGYLDQLMQLVVWDLLSAAVVKFNKMTVSSDYLRVSPFTCTCVLEMWVGLIHLASHRHKALGEESFWVRFYGIIQEVCDVKEQAEGGPQVYDSDVFVNPSGTKPKNPVGFSLWVITHVAHVFTVDEAGHPRTLEPPHSNYFIMKNILQKNLSSSTVTEPEMRSYLLCCLTVARLWGPETSLIALLWDHFYRKLNNSFQVSSTSLDGLAQISKTSKTLLTQCKKWCAEEESLEKENSFHLFLCLMATQISRLMKSGAVQEWRQMKGRFCSKFHQRRMQELSETGLYNFTCLFLTLASITELEDMGKKLCDFYSMLDPSNTSSNRRTITWMGGLALCQICGERNTDMAFVADKLAPSFNSVCREFSDSGLDPQCRHALWRMVSLYLEGLQDVFEASSSLTASEYRLLGEDLSLVFRVCRDGELRFVLNSLHMIVSKFRSVLQPDTSSDAAVQPRLREDQHQAISSYLWLYIYPAVKDHSTTLTPPLSLADLAANLALMARDQPPSMRPTREDFQSVFQHFSSKESVQVSISCHFLCQVLCEDGIMDYMISTNQNAQTQLLQAWFRCVLLLPASSAQLNTLTSIALGIPDIKKVFELARAAIPTDMEEAPKMFLKALGKLYSNTQDLREKMLLREKVMGYFSNVPQHISPILRNMGPVDTLTSLYSSVGHLIKYCSPLLFAQSKTDCPLPAIINAMIVPHFLFKTDKPVNPVFLSAVRANLHLFVQGLGKLDYKRAPYVQRRLGDIVSLYFTRFPLKSTGSSATAVHPLVSSLYGSCVQSPSPESVDLRHLVLEMVHNNYLQLKNQTLPPSASAGLAYVTEVLQRTKGGEVIAKDSRLLIRTSMEYMLLAPSPALKQHSTHITKHLLEACAQNPTVVPVTDLLPVVQGYVGKYLRLQTEGVFQVLGKIPDVHPGLLVQLIPDLTGAVRDLEKKRGVGVDTSLRKLYIDVLSQLGEAGDMEKQRLQLDHV